MGERRRVEEWRGGGKMRETGDKGKKGEKGVVEERKEKTTPCPPPHRFRDSFCLLESQMQLIGTYFYSIWRVIAYFQKSYFHFRFNTNSGGFFPMQSIFYLKPQGHQIWA